MSDSTELANLSDQEYLDLLRSDPFNSDEEFGSRVNARKKLVLLAASKELVAFAFKIGDETINAPPNLPVIFLTTLASKVLWRPKDENDPNKMPACSMELTPPSLEERFEGVWSGGSDFDPPRGSEAVDGQVFKCATCRWNRYGTAEEWDPSKGGRGKACKETANYVVVPMARMGMVQSLADQNPALFWYRPETTVLDQYSDLGFTLLSLGLGSNPKLSEEIFLLARNRRVPINKCVFNCKVKVLGEGDKKYAVVEVSFAGFIAKEHIQDIEDRIARIPRFIKEFSRKVTLSEGEPEQPITSEAVT